MKTEIKPYNDEYFMKQAIMEAEKAFHEDEVPVGAVIVCNEKIIARAHNMVEQLNDVTAHAEMLAITAAEDALGAKFLEDCILYVTIEPCTMCAGALRWSRIGRIVYAASDSKFGFLQFAPGILHPRTKINSTELQNIASELMKKFFLQKR